MVAISVPVVLINYQEKFVTSAFGFFYSYISILFKLRIDTNINFKHCQGLNKKDLFILLTPHNGLRDD